MTRPAHWASTRLLSAQSTSAGMALGYYIERRESGAVGAFQAKTREEADRVLEETIAKIAAKQAIERAKAKPGSCECPRHPRPSVFRAGPIDGIRLPQLARFAYRA